MLPKNAKRLHFIGIGGCGMSGIAWILLKRGYIISGSDLSTNRMTDRLAEHGAHILTGHDAAHLANCDTVIISTEPFDRQFIERSSFQRPPTGSRQRRGGAKPLHVRLVL